MKKLALIAALFSSSALAQQVAQVTSYTVLLDGGVAPIVFGTVTTNYQPVAGTCQVSVPAGSSAFGNVVVLASSDGTHYGIIADAGLNFPLLANDAGAGLSSASFSIAPTNPYQSLQLVDFAHAQDGGTGALSCYVGTIQSQTIHAVNPKAKK